MIWLLIPLVLGVGFVAARVVFDMEKAHADATIAHKATDLHLNGALSSTTVPEAAAHVSAASTANQIAATKSGEIAQNAKTPRDKQVALLMAMLTEANRRRIDLLTAAMQPAGMVPVSSYDAIQRTMQGSTMGQAATSAAYRAAISRELDNVNATIDQLKGQLAVLGVSL